MEAKQSSPTLYGQIKDQLAAMGSPVGESQRMRLHTMPNMLPLNGSVEVDGRITHDFFCKSGHSDGVIVVKAE